MANLPDKWIRKAISDRINNIEVDTLTIPCFDTRVSRGNPDHYILMTTQTNTQTNSKCGKGWESSILLDVVTRYQNSGNMGSRLLSDNIANEILTKLENLTLDTLSGLKINNISIDFPNDLSSVTKTELIYRKLIRYELTID